MPIDSIYDISDKALVEIKSWLEPWFLTRAGGTGGAAGPQGPPGPQGAPGAGTGIFWPAAVQASSSYDTTSYANVPDGSGHYDTLVLNGVLSAFALAMSGDAYPCMLVVGRDVAGFDMGIYWLDGSADPFFGSSAGINASRSGAGVQDLFIRGHGTNVAGTGVASDSGLDTFGVPAGGIYIGPSQNGATLPSQVTHYAGHGAPTIGGTHGDKYWRADGTVGTSTMLYACTVSGGAGVATWVGIL